MNNIKIEKQLMDSLQENAKACAQRFLNVPKNILSTRAEDEAEIYVSNLGIDNGEERDNIKEQFKEVFTREVIENL